MDLLRPVVRPYAWGSRTAIAELQGRPVPAPGPEAELWMGAHPSAPSGTERAGSALDVLIASDPGRELGPACASRFGGRLPFLLKVLSAERALSIQVHPSRAQAQAGFAAESRPGPGRSAPELRGRLAQTRAPVRPHPLRGGGRPAHPGRRGGHPARPGRGPASAAGLPAGGRGRLVRPGGRARLCPGMARARRTRGRRGRRLRAAGFFRRSATQTPARPWCGSPRITRATSGWSRCC